MASGCLSPPSTAEDSLAESDLQQPVQVNTVPVSQLLDIADTEEFIQQNRLNTACDYGIELVSETSIAGFKEEGKHGFYQQLPDKDLYKITYNCSDGIYWAFINLEESKVELYFKTASINVG